MHVDLGTTCASPAGGPAPRPSDHPAQLPTDQLVRHVRRRLVASLGRAAVVAAIAAQALVIPGLQSVDSRRGLVLACTLAQLPVLAVVAAACCCRTHRPRRTPLDAVAELGSRAEHAEAALAREQDRLHELRATVAGISTSYQILREPQSRIAPGRRARLRQLHDAEMGRLQRLLADRDEPARRVDLDAAIDPLVESLRLRGHQVWWTRSGHSVIGRPDDVAEAVHVLLENAVRHGAGGPVAVAVAPCGDQVTVRVSDQGPGVSPVALAHLFERGNRGPGSSGDGLGLSIAYRLAHDMGGRLELEPRRTDETGAAFVLTLPTFRGAASCLAAPG